MNTALSRYLVAFPILKALRASNIETDTLLQKMNTSGKYLRDVLNGARPATLEWYQTLASNLNMEISLVPKHLVRSALIETPSAEHVDRQMFSATSAKILKEHMKLLRNHRIEASLSVEDVAAALGNGTQSFNDYQLGFVQGTYPSVGTLQLYADMLNLAFVAVPAGSVYAGNKMAQYARPVTFKTVTESGLKGKTSIDHVLSDVIRSIKQRPEEFSERYRTLSAVSGTLNGLEPVSPRAPRTVYMPKWYAEKLQTLMEDAKKKGFERIPYANVIKPWGDPKSWAQFKADDLFSDFYRAVENLGLRHADVKVAARVHDFAKQGADVSLSEMFALLKSAQIVLVCDIATAHQTFAIHDPVELSFVLQQLLRERAVRTIEKETHLAPQTLQSLASHPEDNRMSSAFRLFAHFGIRISAQSEDTVLKFENAVNTGQSIRRFKA